MSAQVVELNCPGCGNRVTTGQKQCEYCGGPIVIREMNTISGMTNVELNKYATAYRKVLTDNPDNTDLNKAIAICYLKLKLYDKALAAFENIISNNFDDSEVYYYAAICCLGGKKAFLNVREDIDKALNYLDIATSLENKGIYYYFMAYIKYDYFQRKHLNTSPNYLEILEMADDTGVSDADIEELFAILNVSRPDVM